MLQMFEHENIEYCHWKSNEHLEQALNGETDLDILFSPRQRSEVEMVLNRCKLKRFRSVPLMHYNAVEDFIGFDKETARIWHLHLHYRLTLGEKHLKGYTLPWTEYILENRVLDEKFCIYRSHHEDELFLLILRIALKLRWRDYNKQIGSSDKKEIEWLKKQVDYEKIAEITRHLLDEDCSIEYKNLLKSKLRNKRDLFKLQRMLRLKMRNYTSHNLLSSYLKRSIREWFWIAGAVTRKFGLNITSPNRRISPAGGAVVAILGCDGAGKSTTLAYLRKEFGKKIDVINIYMGSGDGKSSILRSPMLFVAKRVGGKGLGQSIRGEAENKSKISFKIKLYNFAKLLWAIALAIEKKRKLSRVTKARNKGILVLADRYPQVEVYGYNDGPLLSNYLIGKSRLLSNIAKWEIAVYREAYRNPPDLVIKLIVPTELAVKRKPEMTYAEINKKKDAVRRVSLSSNSVEIDTNQDKALSFGKIMEEIWKII